MTHTPEIGADFRRRYLVPDTIWYEKIGAENMDDAKIDDDDAAAAWDLNKYRPHDRTVTAQHNGTVGRGVHVPSCCAVARRIPFAACMKTASKTSLCKYVFHH